MRIRQESWGSMLPTQYTTTHTTHKASMCQSGESCIKYATHTKDFSEQTEKYSEAPSRFQIECKHLSIMIKVRDDD